MPSAPALCITWYTWYNRHTLTIFCNQGPKGPNVWLIVLAWFVYQYSAIHDSVSCLPSLSESCLFVYNFRFSLHSDPFQYDPKKDLACMGDKSSVICTLFKIVFLGKWDECGERPLL